MLDSLKVSISRTNAPKSYVAQTTEVLCSVGTNSPDPEQPEGQHAAKLLRFKTKMCRYYGEGHDCPFDERCVYAHGPKEIRSEHQNLLALAYYDAVAKQRNENVNLVGLEPCARKLSF
eukprot:TRINITY_DN87646_c0_g1_i1.p1 TRINITY_DN87646_c0_g1~~TRINITY_DN87646_c0_g1_i1.p1  ORF type:complete len:118 (-),score=2.84 TRINITY_DN87646_c0_g1_i1:145-498(-)